MAEKAVDGESHVSKVIGGGVDKLAQVRQSGVAASAFAGDVGLTGGDVMKKVKRGGN